MPVWLRKFTFNEMNKFYQEEKEEYEKASTGNKTVAVDSSGKVNTPAFMQTPTGSPPTNTKTPTYTTKASKK